MKEAATVSVELLRDRFLYDPATGVLSWRRSSRRERLGKEAGATEKRGYRSVLIGGVRVKVHRAIWAIHYGTWPTGVIDHINHDKADNRIANLRDVSVNVNQQNRVRAHAQNKVGLLGVSPDRVGFAANIRINGQRKYLGYFTSPEAAHAAYLKAKRELHEGCTL